MPLTPPTNDDLAAIADRYRFGLGAPDIEAFRVLVTGALASYDAVERRYLATVRDAPVRPSQGAKQRYLLQVPEQVSPCGNRPADQFLNDRA